MTPWVLGEKFPRIDYYLQYRFGKNSSWHDDPLWYLDAELKGSKDGTINNYSEKVLKSIIENRREKSLFREWRIIKVEREVLNL